MKIVIRTLDLNKALIITVFVILLPKRANLEEIFK